MWSPSLRTGNSVSAPLSKSLYIIRSNTTGAIPAARAIPHTVSTLARLPLPRMIRYKVSRDTPALLATSACVIALRLHAASINCLIGWDFILLHALDQNLLCLTRVTLEVVV